jgi:hypothetical protein
MEQELHPLTAPSSIISETKRQPASLEGMIKRYGEYIEVEIVPIEMSMCASRLGIFQQRAYELAGYINSNSDPRGGQKRRG